MTSIIILLLYTIEKTIYQKTVPRKAAQGRARSIKKLSRISAQGVLRKAAQGALHKLLPIVTLFSKALFTIMFTYWVGGGAMHKLLPLILL